MIITVTITIPGGLSVARSNRTAIRQASSFALMAAIQQGIETEGGRIVNRDDVQIGEVSLTATYSDAAPRKNYGTVVAVFGPDHGMPNVEAPAISPTQDR